MTRDERFGLGVIGAPVVGLAVAGLVRLVGLDVDALVELALYGLAGLVVVLLVLTGGAGLALPGRRQTVAGHAHGDDQALIATHEGGHAAGARGLGGKVLSGRIWRGGGLVRATIPDEPRAAVAFLSAGRFAAGTREGCAGDDDAIRRELRAVPWGERGKVRAAGERDARRIVRQRRAEIERDAAKLLATGRL